MLSKTASWIVIILILSALLGETYYGTFILNNDINLNLKANDTYNVSIGYFISGILLAFLPMIKTG